ncbi:MAG: DUF3168 domain-containing protein [Schwartzia sp.]|nr:DUF3168 domain-containing protein [Schwartzia sp. (in: firmicutes)]
MSVMAEVYAALKSDARLTVKLAGRAKGIYHLHGPDAGSYPVIVYSTLSDVPALHADNAEIERRVTVRIHIMTRDGQYGGIYDDVKRIMRGIGFTRVQTNEIYDDGLRILVADYRKGTGVDE